jgi:hypothetical protein
LVLASAANRVRSPEEETTQIGAFADIKIEAIDVNEPTARRVIYLSKNGTTVLELYENPSGAVNRFAVVNGRHGNVGLGELDDAGVSHFSVFGNRLRGQERTAVLFLDASNKTPGQWEPVWYAPTTRREREGKTYYNITGEVYDDLDFNGQFDAKRVYNSERQLVGMSLYVYSQWQEILRVNADGLFLQVGKYYRDKGTAFSSQGEQRTHYRFEPGVGWQIEKVDRASVGWPPDPNDPMNRGQRRDDITRIKSEQHGKLMQLPEAKQDKAIPLRVISHRSSGFPPARE